MSAVRTAMTDKLRSQIPPSAPYLWRDDPKLTGLADPGRRQEQAYAASEFVDSFPSGVSDRAKSYVDVPNFDLVPRMAFPSLNVLPSVSMSTFGVTPFFTYSPLRQMDTKRRDGSRAEWLWTRA